MANKSSSSGLGDSAGAFVFLEKVAFGCHVSLCECSLCAVLCAVWHKEPDLNILEDL